MKAKGEDQFWAFMEEVRALFLEHGVSSVDDLPRPVGAQLIRRGLELGYIERRAENRTISRGNVENVAGEQRGANPDG